MEKWKRKMMGTLGYFEALPSEVQVDVAKKVIVHFANAAMNELTCGGDLPRTSEMYQEKAALVWDKVGFMVETEGAKSLAALVQSGKHGDLLLHVLRGTVSTNL